MVWKKYMPQIKSKLIFFDHDHDEKVHQMGIHDAKLESSQNTRN